MLSLLNHEISLLMKIIADVTLDFFVARVLKV